MRAVNLIPSDQRRGGAGERPLAAYGLLAVLALALVAVSALVLMGNQVHSRKDKLARLEQQTTATQARAQQLKPYVDFAELEQSRLSTVRSLASSRFDWARVLHDLDRVVGDEVWLTGLTGTVSPDVNINGGSGSSGSAADSLRPSMPNPAVVLQGCATSHDELVEFVSRLRTIRGVLRVSLAADQKADDTTGGGGSGGGGSSGNGCGNASWPSFSLVAFFKEPPGGVKTGGSSAAASAPSTSTTSTGSSGSTTTSSASSTGSSSNASASGSTTSSGTGGAP